MIWPFKRRKRRELEEAEAQTEQAKRREEEAQPLIRTLHKHDRMNHLNLRVRRSWLGGQQR